MILVTAWRLLGPRPVRTPIRPSAALLHPLWVLALATLLLNDHLLKGHGPGWLTGKLSDFAGFLVLPLLLAALLGVRARAGAALCHLAAAGLLLLLELSPSFGALVAAVAGAPTWRDPWDLLALGSIGLSWLVLVPAAARAAPSGAATERALAAIGALACLASQTTAPCCAPRFGPLPDFGPVRTQEVPPPPVSGGTLIVLADGVTAVAADPDRDRIYVVDLPGARVRADVRLDPADEPGRLVEDGAGRVHVALRNGGALVTIDPASGVTLARRTVCRAPRGVAYQAAGDRVHVACAGGELVTLPAAGGDPTRVIRLEPDLRDVLVDGDHLLVSRFRTAELLVVASDGTVRGRLRPDPFRGAPRGGAPFEPAVAWRTIAMPGGGALMVHQRALAHAVALADPRAGHAPSYGGTSAGCGAIVQSTVTRLGIDARQVAASPALDRVVLPVDLALAPDGTSFAVVAAGSGGAWRPSPRAAQAAGMVVPPPRVFRVPIAGFVGGPECVHPTDESVGGGQPVAVAFAPGGELVVQTRQPAALTIGARVVPLSGEDRRDTGHDVFHTSSGQDLACASCHPEGGEDGRVWVFEPGGRRRTQPLRGGVLAAPPFHWDGEMNTFARLVEQVFVGRMGGPALSDEERAALTGWLDSVPHLPPSPPRDPAAAARGRAIFEDPRIGCANCHSGPRLSSGQLLDVGTGGSFKVPSLRGVAMRAPYLHDGCAPTLRVRFDPACGGAAHGAAHVLDEAGLADLVSYLESL